MEKRVIVLTKSAKHKNYCVAGIDFDSGEFIRIVSPDSDTDGALTDKDLTYEDGTSCRILDVVDFPVIREAPTDEQPENFLINREQCINKISRASFEEVLEKHPAEQRKKLFGTKDWWIDSSNLKKYNVNYSLTLIKAENLKLYWIETKEENQSKLKIDFDFNGNNYKLMSVTDPVFFELKKTENTVLINEAYLVLSIGKEFMGKHYKFVAKIFL